MRLSRKDTRGRVVAYEQGTSSAVYVNNVPYQVLLADLPVYPYGQVLRRLLTLKPGTYHLQVRGGGTMSRAELVPMLMYAYHKQNINTEGIKGDYPLICNPKHRQVYPKRYGGPKSRKRFQKSYR